MLLRARGQASLPLVGLVLVVVLCFYPDPIDASITDYYEFMKNDYYGVLGLEKSATKAEIRRAVRSESLKYHPDKQPRDATPEELEESNAQFLKVSRAGEILKDDEKRKEYDDFISSLPSTMRPKHGVPPVAAWKVILSFLILVSGFHFAVIWSNYQSALTEFTATPGGKRMQEEGLEVTIPGRNRPTWKDLVIVNTALLPITIPMWIFQSVTQYVTDKRQRALDEQERAREEAQLRQEREEHEARKRITQATLTKRRKAEKEEKLARAEREAEEEIERERLKREETDRRRARLRQCRQELKDAVKALNQKKKSTVSADDLHLVSTRVSLDDLELVLTNINAGKTEVFTQQLGKIKAKIAEDKKAANAAKAARMDVKEIKEWSHEEVGLLIKAMTKYPGGTLDRWQKVSVFVGTRTEKEVVAKAKQLNPRSKEGKPSTTTTTTTTSPESPSASNGGDDSSDAWSALQQKQLEQALLNHPKDNFDTVAARWTAIAGEVQGKTLKQCVARFKELATKTASK